MTGYTHSALLSAIHNYSVNCPEKAAIIEGNRPISYKKLMTDIIGTAAFLQGVGLKKNDRILLAAKKEVGFVLVYFAAHYLGIVNVVVDSAIPSDRLNYIVGIVRPKAVFGIKYLSNDFTCFGYGDIVCNLMPVEKESEVDSSDTADIMFTTGTTGNPKGVCLSHYNIASSAKNINDFIGNSSEDVEVLGLPLSHSFGLGRLRCTLLAGGTLVIIGNFANLKSFFQALEEYKATGFGMVPSVWQYIKRLSGSRIGRFSEQLRYIEIGSAAMPLEDKILLSNLFPTTRICMHYGLTEASRAFFMEFHECSDDLQTIGFPVSAEVSACVMDEDGILLPDGEEGEICVRGNMVMKSYFSPGDNDNAFWEDYFRTGDRGFRKADGRFYLTGRQKEMINIGGNKVSPVLIEEAILSLGVEDCACIAIPDPKGVLGEVPKAYIVKGKESIEWEEIQERLRVLLESYQIPVEFEWIDRIPRTSSGKIQRLLLKERVCRH